MKKTTDYYKAAIRQAERAREAIVAAKEAYEHECMLTKNALDAGILGENGYREQLGKLAQDRDAKIEGALSRVDEVAAEYSSEMAQLGRLDGSRIDEGTMKLLDSGIQLTTGDWQELANTHKDNHVMTRILRERYNANRPKENGPGLTFVKFGQSPADRQEVFGQFARTLRHSCNSEYMPQYGCQSFASRTDYWHYLAKGSLEKMQPFGEESFDSVASDFPVALQEARPTIF